MLVQDLWIKCRRCVRARAAARGLGWTAHRLTPAAHVSKLLDVGGGRGVGD